MQVSDVINGANLVLVSLILVISGAIKQVFSDFFSSALGQRLMPLVPIVLGVIGGIAGLGQTSGAIADKIVVGLLSGLSAAGMYKLSRTTVLGKGLEDSTKK